MKFNLLLLFIVIGLSGCASKGGSSTTNKTASPVQASQYSGTGTLVIKPIDFAKNSYVREAVRNECNLITKLTDFIDQNAAKNYAKIITDSRSIPKGAEVLTIEIEQVQGGGGGAWSGAKVVLINGKLTKNGKLLGDFKARRYSGGGMFAAYKGTCAILGRCVKTLGSDVAKWLSHPTKNAALGDL